MHTQNKSTSAGHTALGALTNALASLKANAAEAAGMAEHTAGPWSVATRKDGLGSLPNRDSVEIVHNYPSGGGQQVIVGRHCGMDCLTSANARLIAAAPELLEALELLLEVANNTDELVDTPFTAQARAAIARAKGVQS